MSFMYMHLIFDLYVLVLFL